MKSAEFKIEGMTCNHCVMAVKKELQKIPGVQVEDVQIGHARVSFDESRTSEKVLSTAIEDAGYAIVR